MYQQLVQYITAGYSVWSIIITQRGGLVKSMRWMRSRVHARPCGHLHMLQRLIDTYHSRANMTEHRASTGLISLGLLSDCCFDVSFLAGPARVLQE